MFEEIYLIIHKELEKKWKKRGRKRKKSVFVVILDNICENRAKCAAKMGEIGKSHQ